MPPKFVSPTDSAARWTAAAGSPASHAQCDNHLIDVEHAVIADIEATSAVRQAEAGAAQTTPTRTAETFGLWSERLVADTGYGAATTWHGIAGPAGMAPDVVLRTNEVFNAIIGRPEIQDNLLRAQGAEFVGGAPEAFAAFVRREAERWIPIIRAANIKAG